MNKATSTSSKIVIQKAQSLRIANAQALPDFKLLLEFSSCQLRILDLDSLQSFSVFHPLKTRQFDRFRIIAGSLQWHKNIEISFEDAYENSMPIN